MTKFSAKLPETANGLDAISDKILAAPRDELIVVAILDCPKAEEDFDNGRRIPHMRVRAIEPLEGTEGDRARKMLEKAYVKRTGQNSLTLDDAIAGKTDEGEDPDE